MKPEVLTAIQQATYLVSAEFSDEEIQEGTGFCILTSGLILTCSHVISRVVDGEIETASSILVMATANSIATPYEALIVKNGSPSGPMLPANMSDPDLLDLAVLQLKGNLSLPQLVFLHAPPLVGTRTVSMGASENAQGSVTYDPQEGQVTGVFVNPTGVTCLIRHSCAIREGFSGGPLTDDDGNVIGVNVLQDPMNPRRYAIAGSIVWEFVPEPNRDGVP